MASSTEDRPRFIVPRLRVFEIAVRMDELSSLRPQDTNPFLAEMLNESLRDWEATPTIPVAADLVSEAVVLGQPEVALEAADFLLHNENTPTLAHQIAAFCTGQDIPPLQRKLDSDGLVSDPFAMEQFYSLIHLGRKQLIIYPNNAVLWTNLACMYTALGQQRPAHRAIRAALTLAPHNRFILRSASRLLLHQGEGAEAHRILEVAPGLKRDPWLLSAEIATAAAMGRVSRFAHIGESVLDADRAHPFDSSELASAVATLDVFSGNRNRAKKLVRKSLRNPSENAVAQAAWLAHKFPGLPELSSEKTSSFEANTCITRQRGHLKDALLQSRHWLGDQPFSRRPALAGSFLASRIDRHAEGVLFARHGLISNPNDNMLNNNLAFSLGKLGRTQEARRALKGIDLSSSDNVQKIVTMATTGLVCFREGNLLMGRQLYVRAAELAHEAGDDAREAVAAIYHAIEEIRIGTSGAESYRQAALYKAKKLLKLPEDTMLINQLNNATREDS